MKFFEYMIKFRYFVFILLILIVGFLPYRAKKIEIDFSTRSLYITKDTEVDYISQYRSVFGDDDGMIIIGFKTDKIFTSSFFFMLNELSKQFENIKIKRPYLKIDYDERERASKKLDLKKVNFNKDIKEIVKENNDDEEIIEDESDLFEDDEKTSLSSFEKKVGEIINPIEYVISLTNAQNIHGEKGDDNINSIIIEPFITKEELNNFKKDDVSELTSIKEKVAKNNLLKKQIVSDDLKTTAIIIKMDNILTTELERRPVLEQINSIVNKYFKDNKDIISKLNLEYGISGIPLTQNEYTRLIESDMFFFFGMSAMFMGFLLIFIFKKAHGVYIPLGIVSLAAVSTFGIMQIFGESINIVNNIIPTLILVIGLSDTIHLLQRYHTEININGLSKVEAIKITFKDMYIPCFLTSFTTAIGFFSLITAKIDIIRMLGIYSSIGVMLSYFFIFLILPGLLYILPVPRYKNQKEFSFIKNKHLELTAKIAIKHSKKVVAVYLLVIGIMSFFMFKMDIDTHMLEELKENNPIKQGILFVEKNLTGVLPIEISITAKSENNSKNNVLRPDILEAMDKLKIYLRNDKNIGFILTISDYIKESYFVANGNNKDYYKIPSDKDGVNAKTLILNYYDRLKDSTNGERDIGNIISFDGNRARMSFAQSDVGLNMFFKTVDGINKKIKEYFPKDVDVKLTGGTYVAYRALSFIVSDMISSLLSAFLFIAITMMLSLRSIKLGLMSALPNMLPVLFTIGVMGIWGITVRTSTVIIFSIALGIAVDDSIHFLSRYKFESLTEKVNELCLYRTIMETGRAIVFTSVLIVFGVIVLVFSDFIAIIHYAILTSIIMIVALIGSVLFIPALLQIFNPLGLKRDKIEF